MTPPVHRELILGGQKSGKSRRAELLAQAWLQAGGHDAAPPGSVRDAVLVATAEAHDADMRARIARHQADRARRVPGLRTLEEPLALAAAVQRCSHPQCLVVVDCLPLWLTRLMMPMDAAQALKEAAVDQACQQLVQTLQQAPGPVVLVSNEIGLGVIPLGREVRRFVDVLGGLHQQLAAVCDRVTLMAAGLPLTLKGPA